MKAKASAEPHKAPPGVNTPTRALSTVWWEAGAESETSPYLVNKSLRTDHDLWFGPGRTQAIPTFILLAADGLC